MTMSECRAVPRDVGILCLPTTILLLPSVVCIIGRERCHMVFGTIVSRQGLHHRCAAVTLEVHENDVT